MFEKKILFRVPAKLSHPLRILNGMTTSSFPVRTSALLGSADSRVVAFRSRNPIQVADQFSREMSDNQIRLINCDDCVMQCTSTCTDCVVSYLLTNAAQDHSVSITAPEMDTLAMLQATGLAPQSQYAVRPVSLATRRLTPC
jgi:hypothetical protein